MQSLSTFSCVPLFGSFVDHVAYYYHDRYDFQGCAGFIPQGRWKRSGRRGRYCEERWRDKGGRSMFPYTTWFLASPFISFTVVIHTSTFYNFNFGERQQGNGQVR